MTEVEVNGSSRIELDISATKTALSSSSTNIRLGLLQLLEDRLSKNGKIELVS